MSRPQVIIDDTFIKSVCKLDRKIQIKVWDCIRKLIQHFQEPPPGLGVTRIRGNLNNIFEARVTDSYRLIFEKIRLNTSKACRLIYVGQHDDAIQKGKEAQPRSISQIPIQTKAYPIINYNKQGYIDFTQCWSKIIECYKQDATIETLVQRKLNVVSKVQFEDGKDILFVLTDRGLRKIPITYLKNSLKALIDKGKLLQKDLPEPARYCSAFIMAYLFDSLKNYLEIYKDGKSTGIRFKPDIKIKSNESH